MKNTLTFLIVFMISNNSFADKRKLEVEYKKNLCSENALSENPLTKVCVARDFIAPKVRKREKDWLAFLAAEGSSGYKGSNDSVVKVLEFQYQELNFQGHTWDFSNRENALLIFKIHDSIIKSGNIINTKIHLGSGYQSPNFSTMSHKDFKADKENYNYAKNDKFSNRSIENISFQHINFKGDLLQLKSWNSEILKSNLLLKNNLYIDGSKTKIIKNKIISNAITSNKKIFNLVKSKKNNFIDLSEQIFPDITYNTSINCILYIKFSPESVIDGNIFTLTQPNINAYAIILDHSPRVRISNNTFNGFKVPILMDQWSSIVDENGNEIKPEDFKGQGNTMHPDKFAGNVTMNRKGEIELEYK